MGSAHPWRCRGCGPLSPVGRSGGGSTGRPRSCVDEGERIMNDGAATAFLPNFVTFPSLRGLHSSTVQPGRTPRPFGVRRGVRAPTGSVARRALWWGVGPGPRVGPCGGDAVPPARRLSCPVSAAASAASAAAPSPAGRPASAGRAATTGVARVVAAGGRTAPVARPPAVGAAAAVAAPAGARPARPPPGPGPGGARGAPARHESPDHQGCDHEQDDACDHGSTLLPFPGPRPEVPRSNPPSDASLRVDCLSLACGSRREAHRRAREMPLAATPQSRVEEVQSFGAG